jgi:hypothetical protein
MFYEAGREVKNEEQSQNIGIKATWYYYANYRLRSNRKDENDFGKQTQNRHLVGKQAIVPVSFSFIFLPRNCQGRVSTCAGCGSATR